MRAGRLVKAVAVGAAVLVGVAGAASAEPYEDGRRLGREPVLEPATSAGTRRPRRTASTTSPRSANRIYVAGVFHRHPLRQPGHVSGRAYLIALDADSGEPDWSFAPRFNGPVYTLAVVRRRPPPLRRRRLHPGRRPGPAPSRRPGPAGRVDTGLAGAGRAAAPCAPIVATRSYLYVGGNFAGGQRRRPPSAWPDSTGRRAGVDRALERPRDRAGRCSRWRCRRAGTGSTSAAASARSTAGATPTAWSRCAPQDGGVDAAFGRQPGGTCFDLLADGRGRLWVALDGAGGRAEVLEQQRRASCATWDDRRRRPGGRAHRRPGLLRRPRVGARATGRWRP